MDGKSAAAQLISRFLPLIHLMDTVRQIMLNGAGVTQVLPEIALLGALSLLFLATAAALFRWNSVQ